MKYFCVFADFKEATIEGFDCLNDKYQDAKIIETYGNIPANFMGSGRSNRYLYDIDLKKLSKYIKYSHKYNIQFDYTLNAACCGNIELTSKGAKKILRYALELIDAGVDRFTIAIPSIIELLVANIPGVKISASAIAHIDSLNKIETLEELGCDRIVLDENMNRDFELIKSASLLIDMEVIVNYLCRNSCPFEYYHYNTIAHGTSTSKANALEDYYMYLRCHIEQFKDPIAKLKAGWIRPEDIKYYENVGVKYFKIIGRIPTDYDILKTVDTYMSEKYKGNLQQLFRGFRPVNIFQDLFYLDNNKLEGFIDYFIKNKPNCRHGCIKCKHCNKYAKRALRVNKKMLRECLLNLDNNLLKYLQKIRF